MALTSGPLPADVAAQVPALPADSPERRRPSQRAVAGGAPTLRASEKVEGDAEALRSALREHGWDSASRAG